MAAAPNAGPIGPYTFSFAAHDDNLSEAAILAAAAPDLDCAVPDGYWILNAVQDLPQTPSTAKPGYTLVPLWALHMLCGAALRLFAAHGWFVTDSAPHPTTLAYTLDNAESQGFPLDATGGNRHWTSMLTFAADLAAHAQRKIAAGDDASPWELYHDDAIHFVNAAATPPLIWINTWTVDELCAPSALPWALVHYLLHPIAPHLALGPGDSAGIVLRVVEAAARLAFPALAAASITTAVRRLLTVEVPFELLAFVDTADARIDVVELLRLWHLGQERVRVVRQSFTTMLPHLPHLNLWVGGADTPYQEAVQLLAMFHIAAVSPLVDEFRTLNGRLGAPAVAGLHSTARSTHDNLAFLRQQQRPGPAASGSNAAQPTSSLAPAADTTNTGARLLSALHDAITAHMQTPEASTFSAMRLVMHSQSAVAVRWQSLDGKPPPGILATDACATYPACMDDYVVHMLVHDDDGVIDPDLQHLQAHHFYAPGATTVDAQRRFFLLLYQRKYTEINWDSMLVRVIESYTNPDAATFAAMRQVYGSVERMESHLTYVSRALDAIGKPSSAPNSYASLVEHWRAPLKQARKTGAAVVEDVLDKVELLMSQMFIKAQQLDRAAMRATTVSLSLFDDTFDGVRHFDDFVSGLRTVREQYQHFKRTYQAMMGAAPQGPRGPPGPRGPAGAGGKPAKAGDDKQQSADLAVPKLETEGGGKRVRVGPDVHDHGNGWWSWGPKSQKLYSKSGFKNIAVSLGLPADLCQSVTLATTAHGATKKQAVAAVGSAGPDANAPQYKKWNDREFRTEFFKPENQGITWMPNPAHAPAPFRRQAAGRGKGRA
jgi:hypothetical protein